MGFCLIRGKRNYSYILRRKRMQPIRFLRAWRRLGKMRFPGRGSEKLCCRMGSKRLEQVRLLSAKNWAVSRSRQVWRALKSMRSCPVMVWRKYIFLISKPGAIWKSARKLSWKVPWGLLSRINCTWTTNWLQILLFPVVWRISIQVHFQAVKVWLVLPFRKAWRALAEMRFMLAKT